MVSPFRLLSNNVIAKNLRLLINMATRSRAVQTLHGSNTRASNNTTSHNTTFVLVFCISHSSPLISCNKCHLKYPPPPSNWCPRSNSALVKQYFLSCNKLPGQRVILLLSMDAVTVCCRPQMNAHQFGYGN